MPDCFGSLQATAFYEYQDVPGSDEEMPDLDGAMSEDGSQAGSQIGASSPAPSTSTKRRRCTSSALSDAGSHPAATSDDAASHPHSAVSGAEPSLASLSRDGTAAFASIRANGQQHGHARAANGEVEGAAVLGESGAEAPNGDPPPEGLLVDPPQIAGNGSLSGHHHGAGAPSGGTSDGTSGLAESPAHAGHQVVQPIPSDQAAAGLRHLRLQQWPPRYAMGTYPEVGHADPPLGPGHATEGLRGDAGQAVQASLGSLDAESQPNSCSGERPVADAAPTTPDGLRAGMVSEPTPLAPSQQQQTHDTANGLRVIASDGHVLLASNYNNNQVTGVSSLAGTAPASPEHMQQQQQQTAGEDGQPASLAPATNPHCGQIGQGDDEFPPDAASSDGALLGKSDDLHGDPAA